MEPNWFCNVRWCREEGVVGVRRELGRGGGKKILTTQKFVVHDSKQSFGKHTTERDSPYVNCSVIIDIIFIDIFVLILCF